MMKRKGAETKEKRTQIESMVGNREKYALIRVSAGNLWICGQPDAYRRWPASRDGCCAASSMLFVYG